MNSVRNLALCLVLGASASVCRAQSVITYHIEPHIAERTYRITMDIPKIHELTVRLQMPVWSPGAYFVGNFATGVSDVGATEPGRSKPTPLRVFHPDPNTWEIGANGAHSVQFQYTVKGADLEAVDGKPRRGHISGPRTYMYVVGRKAEPVELDIAAPTGATAWKIANSLDPLASTTPGVTKFIAPTYDVLADAPIEMGDFDDIPFEAGGKPHHVILYGHYENIDKPKITDFCKRIAETEIAFFGGAPFARYMFEFATNTGMGRGAGGLEHLGSTEIGTVAQVDDRVRSVIAHEYFHLWNVKRIRPFVLGPFNYVDPPHTANLWWSEGVTSYYGDLLSLRGGLNTRDEYLTHISSTISELQNNPARLLVSADSASLRVWEANNSQGFGNISYYTKGELVGMCLDLKIRHITNGKATLDDVMRALWAQVKHGDGPGFGEDDIKKTVNRISGHDLSAFYDSAARSGDELPYDECLGYAGLTLSRVEPATLVGDAGMRTGFDRTSMGISVAEVTPGGAAEHAGLKVGDKITAINGASDGRGPGRALLTAKPSSTVKLTITRAGASQDIDLVMGSRAVYSWKISVGASPTPEQLSLRDDWLRTH